MQLHPGQSGTTVNLRPRATHPSSGSPDMATQASSAASLTSVSKAGRLFSQFSVS